MSFFASVCLLLACAHALGWLAERCGQPALLGHMLAGIMVGPSILKWLPPGPALAAIADISVLFVVISAGLEMRMQHVVDTLRGKGAVALALSFLIPAAATATFTYVLGMDFVPAIVVVLCISVTALPVALRFLSEFQLLNTRVARIAISSALLTDIVVLLTLGIAIAVSRQQDAGESIFATGGIAMAKLALLLAVVGGCYFVCSKVSAQARSLVIPRREVVVDGVLITVIVSMFLLGVVSEQLGFHFVIGVFIASLLVTRELVGDARFRNLEYGFEVTTVSIFGPLFLAYQGVQFEVGALEDAVLVFGLILIAVVSKLIGGYAAARLNVLPHYEACGVAIIMNARGVMEMVVASIAYRAGLVSQELFSTLLIVGIVTTVITPSMLKYWLKDEKKMKAMLSAGETGA